MKAGWEDWAPHHKLQKRREPPGRSGKWGIATEKNDIIYWVGNVAPSLAKKEIKLTKTGGSSHGERISGGQPKSGVLL